MTRAKAVTFTLPNGARVTASEQLARRLGWAPAPTSDDTADKPKPRRRKPASK